MNAARENADLRKSAIQMLSARYRGFNSPTKNVSQRKFLKDIARSKICIDLPGNGFLCYRLVECLGVGACVVSPRHPNCLPVPLEDRTHIVYCEPDLSNLIEICDYYIHQDEEREAIAQNGVEYFDRYLHRNQLVHYYLSTCVRSLDEQLWPGVKPSGVVAPDMTAQGYLGEGK